MTELHPSISAVGAHFDSEVEKVISAHRPHQGTGGLGSQSNELSQQDTMGAQVTGQRGFRPADMDRQTEEMMLLAQ